MTLVCFPNANNEKLNKLNQLLLCNYFTNQNLPLKCSRHDIFNDLCD